MPRHYLALVATAILLSACSTPTDTAAATLDEPDIRRGEQVKQVCFTGSISGFSHTTKNSVVISKGLKDYLVTTRSRCPDLDHAQALALKPFSSCLSRGDKLIGFDSPFGRHSGVGPIPCYVDRIYEWDDKATEVAPDPEADTEPES